MARRRPLSERTLLVLTALAAEPLPGHGIVAAASRLSDGEVTLRVGTLYGALDRLCADGLVEPDREEIHQGRVRRYYRITPAGTAERVRRAHTAGETPGRSRGGLRAHGMIGEASA